MFLSLISGTFADEYDAEKLNFFESRIRPLLEQHCIECHQRGGELSGGLVLSDRDGVVQGGDSGPAVNLDSPSSSLLVQATSYDNPHLQMPPDNPLSALEKQALLQWISDGLTDPRHMDPTLESSRSTALPLELAAEHWAYRPLTTPSIPNADAPTPIDCYVNAMAAQNGIELSSAADRNVLLRRLTYDLHGIPPSYEQYDQFVTQRSWSYEELVDNLLADHKFGERFARRWMDIARYADSLTLRGFVLKDAWRYRNYLIDSFNQDTPYTQFVQEQLCGDLLALEHPDADSATQARWLVASSYLLLGNTNLEEQDKTQLEMDIVDEQLDVITKGLLGQTVTCARCHDHKFDPIPTRDYYALAGILKSARTVKHANVSEWLSTPLPLEPNEQQAYQHISDELAALKRQLTDINQEISQLVPGDGPVAVEQLAGIVLDDTQATKVGDWMHSVHYKHFVGSGYIHDQNQAKGEASLTFSPAELEPGEYLVRFAYQHGDNRSSAVRITIASADGETAVTIDQTKAPPIDNLWFDLGKFRFEKDGQAYVLITNADTNGHVIADAIQFLLLNKSNKTEDSTDSERSQAESDRVTALKQLRQSLTEQASILEKRLANRPTCLGIERLSSEDIPVHIRGSVHSLGEMVPRGFLQCIPYDIPDSTNLTRRELAAWITSENNPLTSRVYVNRIWQHLMGRAIVPTTDNFGTTGEQPSHPELLDYLATDFQINKWSTKSLVKQIVMSDAYQRSSQSPANVDHAIATESYAIAERKRLDAESIRDTLLVASGEIDWNRDEGQLAANLANDFNYQYESLKRSVYLPVFRNSPNPVIAAFDPADSSSVVGTRNETIVASQSLLMLNSTWLNKRIHMIAQRISKSPGSVEEKLNFLGIILLCRPLSTQEQQIAVAYLKAPDLDASEDARWEDVVRGLVGSIDFRYRH